VKKVINYIEQAQQLIAGIVCPDRDVKIALELLDYALEELQSPRWETHDRWEKRRGEAWPDDGAVYYKTPYEDISPKTKQKTGEIKYSRWKVGELHNVRMGEFMRGLGGLPYIIICATEAGPPPDDWRPEEG
jgi:hypothetical protein